MYPSLQRAAQENQRRTHKSKFTHTYVNTHIRAPHTHTHTRASQRLSRVSQPLGLPGHGVSASGLNPTFLLSRSPEESSRTWKLCRLIKSLRS